MPNVGIIPLGMPIVDTKDGTINEFFRRQWEGVQQSAQVVPTKQTLALTAQTAAPATTTLFTVQTQGFYRVTLYLRRTAIDGVSSSLQATLHWLEHTQPLDKALPAMATDSLTQVQETSSALYCDANSTITMNITYASNTPGAMAFEAFAAVEQIS